MIGKVMIDSDDSFQVRAKHYPGALQISATRGETPLQPGS